MTRTYDTSITTGQIVELLDTQTVIIPYGGNSNLQLTVDYKDIEDINEMGEELVRIGEEMKEEYDSVVDND